LQGIYGGFLLALCLACLLFFTRARGEPRGIFDSAIY
jgi:hypothetical protein